MSHFTLERAIEVRQVVSDLCGAIRACTQELEAEHIPELFHAQQEISKATSAALASQKRSVEKKLNAAEVKLQKVKDKPRRLKKTERDKQKSDLKTAEKMRDKLRLELKEKGEREENVRAARKQTSKILHPIDLKTGKLQSEEEIKEQFNEQFEVIRKEAKLTKLSVKSIQRIEKAKRAFDDIATYLKFYFTFFLLLLESIELESEQEEFFIETVFPLVYLKMIWHRLKKNEKEELYPLLESLKSRSRDATWVEKLKKEWEQRAQELAELFQRSSSCVEGRNGILSFNYARFHPPVK